jgi:hypothetical protein
MSLYVISGFSTSGSAQSMTATIAGNVMTIADGTYAFAAFTSLTGTGTYTAFAAAVKAAADTAGGGPYTVTWSSSTYAFTISRAGVFTLAFSSAADLRLRAALGFAANLSGANTYTSTVRPYYVIVPATDARTLVSDVFEPEDMVDDAEADDGTPYGVSPNTTTNLRADWVHGLESYEATFSRAAAAAVPWTWQHMIQHCRAQHPFGVYETGLSSTLHRFTKAGASFRPERNATDDNTYWNVPMYTRDRGVLP